MPAMPRKTRWTQMRQGARANWPSRCRAANTARTMARKIRWAAARPALAPGIKMPDANDLARARDILQELRRRAGERGRPPQELDYIDRLLQRILSASQHLANIRQSAVLPRIVHAIADDEIIADGKADIIGLGHRIGALLVQHHRHLHAGRARRLDQRHRLGDGAAGIQHAVDHQHMAAGDLFGRARDHGNRAGHPLVAIGAQPEHLDIQMARLPWPAPASDRRRRRSRPPGSAWRYRAFGAAPRSRAPGPAPGPRSLRR